MKIDKAYFKEIIKKLNAVPGINFLENDSGFCLDKFPCVIEEIYEKACYKCDSSIEDFYRFCGAPQLKWNYKNSEQASLHGYIQIVTLDDLLLGEKNIAVPVPKGEEFKNVLWMEDWDDEEIERRKPYKALEYVDGRGDWVALLIDETTGASTLYYLDKFQETPLLVNFEQYMQLVFTSYGVIDRDYLTKKEFFSNPYAMQPDLTKLKSILPMEDFDAVIAEIQKGMK